MYLPKDTFWITDCGNKFIQVQALARADDWDFRVPYPARELDPELRFFPFSGHHFLRVDGDVVSFYPPYFPLLSVVPYRLFGTAGIYLLPLLSSWFCLIAVSRLSGKQGDVRLLAVLVLGLCTPLFFYSLTFWEHTTAMALAAWGLCLFLETHRPERETVAWLAGGLLVGFATVLREEGYLFLMSVLVGHWAARRTLRPAVFFLAGWLLTMMPLWVLQESIFGHFLGLHAVAYTTGLAGDGVWAVVSFCREKLTNLWVYLFAVSHLLWVNLPLAVPFLTALAAGVLIRPPVMTSAIARWAMVASCVSGLAVLAELALHPEPVYETLHSQALLLPMPFLVFWLLSQRSLLTSAEDHRKFMSVAASVYVVLACVMLNRRDMGIIWGARHFLQALPFMVPLAIHGFRVVLDGQPSARWKTATVASGIVLLIASAGIQVHGIRILHLKKQGSQRILERVRSMQTDVIATDVFWLTEEMASLYFEKQIVSINAVSLPLLVDRLRQHGTAAFCFVTSPIYGRPPGASLARLLARADRVETVHTPGLDFMRLRLYRIPLGNSAGGEALLPDR